MTQKSKIFCLKMLTLVVMTEYNNFRVRQDEQKKCQEASQQQKVTQKMRPFFGWRTQKNITA